MPGFWNVLNRKHCFIFHSDKLTLTLLTPWSRIYIDKQRALQIRCIDNFPRIRFRYCDELCDNLMKHKQRCGLRRVRNSCPEVFSKKVFLRSSTKISSKHLRRSLILTICRFTACSFKGKITPAQVFPMIFKRFFYRTPTRDSFYESFLVIYKNII